MLWKRFQFLRKSVERNERKFTLKWVGTLQDKLQSDTGHSVGQTQNRLMTKAQRNVECSEQKLSFTFNAGDVSCMVGTIPLDNVHRINW